MEGKGELLNCELKSLELVYHIELARCKNTLKSHYS
jgi:hypothetical protein